MNKFLLTGKNDNTSKTKQKQNYEWNCPVHPKQYLSIALLEKDKILSEKVKKKKN